MTIQMSEKIRFFLKSLRWAKQTETYINNGFNTDLMWVNEARLTNSRNTDSANTGGDDADDSSLDIIGVDDWKFKW